MRLVAEIRSTLPVNLLPDLDRFETVFRTYLEAMRQVSYDYLLAHNLLSEAIRNRIDDAKIDHAESQAQVVEIPSVAEWLLEGGRSALISAAKSWVGLSREQKMARYQGALRLFEGVKHNFELAFNLLPAILTDQLVKSEEAKSRQLSNQIEAGRDVAGYLLKHLFEHRKGLESLLVSTTKTAKSRQHLLKGSFPLFREELKVFEAIEQRETDLAEGKRLLREDHSRLLLTTKEGEETEGQGVKKEAKK